MNRSVQNKPPLSSTKSKTLSVPKPRNSISTNTSSNTYSTPLNRSKTPIHRESTVKSSATVKSTLRSKSTTTQRPSLSKLPPKVSTTKSTLLNTPKQSVNSLYRSSSPSLSTTRNQSIKSSSLLLQTPSSNYKKSTTTSTTIRSSSPSTRMSIRNRSKTPSRSLSPSLRSRSPLTTPKSKHLSNYIQSDIPIDFKLSSLNDEVIELYINNTSDEDKEMVMNILYNECLQWNYINTIYNCNMKLEKDKIEVYIIHY